MTPTSPFPEIRLLVLDVDGVLTDGSIQISDRGEELKRFNVRDGFAIKLWQRLGREVAIITGRSGDAVRHRASELGITRLVQGSKDKAADLETMLTGLEFGVDRVAFVGDDWPDLGPMRRVAVAIAPADADARVLEVATHVTAARGGQGAVREAVEYLLRGMGLYERALALYDRPA